MKYLLVCILSLLSVLSFSQTIEGVWNTFDDKTNELESEVEIYKKNGKLYGKLTKLYNVSEEERNKKCVRCTDYRKNQPVVGMVFISGLKQDGKEWTGSKKVLDPSNGKSYDAKIWLADNDKLALRGYLGLLYRTQYWERVK